MIRNNTFVTSVVDPNPDLLVTSKDPDMDPSIIKQENNEKKP
jgi:hypothetical protein